MADFRLGRLKFNWKGNWAVSTAYVIDDIVKYGAYTYVCTTNHTSTTNENTFYSADVAKWSLHTEGIVNKGNWAATTWYKLGDVVKSGNTQYLCSTAHTSGAAFDATKFTTYVEGLKYENSWVASTAYQIGDIVSYGGYAYTAKVDHSNTVTPNADTVNWAALSTGFLAKGVYNNATSYAPGDVVRYGGYSYVNKLSSVQQKPTDATYWDLITEGFNWLGAYSTSTVYQKGDVVSSNSNTYVCITSDTTGNANSPANDASGNYWNYIAQGGSAAQVLQTAGDLLYQAASGINRIALPAGSTGTAAEQRNASGQVLTVGGSPLLPRWEKNNVTSTVYYVAQGGSDSNSGDQIGRAFATIRHACDTISALTGSDKPSLTNPISIYVKAGVYEEILPIQIPPYVSVLGDNIRTTVVKPAAGNSNMQALTLGSSVTSLKMGDTVSNAAGTKTAKVLDSNHTNAVHILNVTGGLWTTSDKYVDIIGNKNADASDLLGTNATFIAHEAYHRHVANNGAVSGTEATVKSRLESFVTALKYNVKAGSNNKVWDWGNTLVVTGTPVTGNNTQDTQLLNYIKDVGTQVVRNEAVTVSGGNAQTQTTNSAITADTASPKCATVVASLGTLVDIVTAAITATNMSGTAKTEPYLTISGATNNANNEASMFFLGTHTIIKDIVMQDLTGFVPNGSDDKDIDNSTITGVYLRLDPNSPIQKSPYIQNCSAIGGAAVGAFIDGGSHKHFDNSSTPSFKSAAFDAFTQVLEGGVGFYCKGTAALEIVSSFTYYAHISYISTGGGRIRAVSGNSSYGKYGCIAQGFDAAETTTDGTVDGLRLEVNPSGTNSGTFSATSERIVGGTSGAVGELRSDQSTATNYMFYLPVKGTFANNELITGQTSGATATTAASNAVVGQKGFILLAAGLTAAPDQGGSVSLVDDGSNNDASSYVISKSSYSAPDGRGSLAVTRAQLGSSAASGSGTDTVALFPTVAQTATLQTNISSGASSPFTMNVDAVTGMTINGFLIIGNELFKVDSFPSATSVTASRAQEGTTAGTHTSGATIKILNAKVASQDEVIEDYIAGATSIRVKAANVAFKATDYIKVGNEFMLLTAVNTDTTGMVIITLSDEKAISAGDGQSFKIRYRYSQVRLTAHDFLDVGTGNRTTTNWPYLPTQQNVPSQEIDETRPGRVYYVSTDQDGNFAVGEYFKVEQATGKATLNANAFNLTGLDTLRLGAIGAQLGATIDEFSTDGTLAQNSDVKVPTQAAVKTYVDNLSGVDSNFSVGGNLTVKGTTTTVASVDVSTKDRNIILGKVASGNFTGNITSGAATITNISDTDNLAPGVVVALTGGGASVTLSGTVKVLTVDSATQVTLDASFGGTGSATGATFSAGGPTDDTADGGGITLKATSDQSIAWSNANDRWDISDNINIPTGKKIYINGTEVLSSTQVLGVSIGGGGGGAAVTTDGTQTLSNKTIDDIVLTGTLSAGGGVGTSGQYLQSTATGIQWATLTVDATSIQNGTSNVTVATNSNITVTTAGNTCATFDTSNNLTVVGNVTAQSSIALKDNVTTITDGLSKILGLRGVEFDYKSNGQHNIGLVAEEVEEVLPELVHTTGGIKSLAYQNIVAVLVEAVKDLKMEIDQLKGVK